MSLSMEFKQRAMVATVDSYLLKFQEAMTLSAKRGGFKGGMSIMVARLYSWKKQRDYNFTAWATLTQEAGDMWTEWYDWYSRFDQRIGLAPMTTGIQVTKPAVTGRAGK